MRILVTGASGHVGGAIAERLAEAGNQVIGVSRRLMGPSSLAETLAVDISSVDALRRLAGIEPCQAVVHAAAEIDTDPFAPGVSLVNCLGTQGMLWLTGRWACERFVFLSSVPVIGHPKALPVTEEHSVDPPTTYHASKVFGEQLTELARRRGVAGACLRLTSPVGPRMPGGRIFSVFVSRALAGQPLEVAGQGTRAQDYVDVRDVADAALACLESGAADVFNVASGRAVTNAELARRCVEALGSRSEIRTGMGTDAEEGVRWEVSIARSAKAFGYAPRRSLEDSVVAAAEYPERGLARAIKRSPRRLEFNQ